MTPPPTQTSVFALRHRVQMFRVDAPPMQATGATDAKQVLGMACVVEGQPFRNRADKQLIGEPMGHDGPPHSKCAVSIDVHSEHAIAAGIDGTRPRPARMSFVHVEPESFSVAKSPHMTAHVGGPVGSGAAIMYLTHVLSLDRFEATLHGANHAGKIIKMLYRPQGGKG